MLIRLTSLHIGPVTPLFLSLLVDWLAQMSQTKTGRSSCRAAKAPPLASKRAKRPVGQTKGRPSHQRCGQTCATFTSVSSISAGNRRQERIITIPKLPITPCRASSVSTRSRGCARRPPPKKEPKIALLQYNLLLYKLRRGIS